MEFTKKISCKIRVRASLDDDGSFKVGVAAEAPYPGVSSRTASWTLEDVPEKLATPVKKALVAVMEAMAAKAADRAQLAASQAEQVARDRRELD